MRGICPNCEKETNLELIRTTENIEVRGEQIEVEMEYYRCLDCGEEFEDPRSDHDPLDKAYREYRRRHGMTQPEEIRSLRKRYGLTQSELAKLLGWGAVTLSRYENGALQDETHEKTFRLAMEPRNLSKLIKETPDAIPQEIRDWLLEEFRHTEQEAYSFSRIYEERFGGYKPDVFSGYKSLDLAKLYNAILYMCTDGVLKTVLNKLLFYMDFKHFKDNAVSITGSRYVRIKFGPAPDKWQFYLTSLMEEGALDVEEIFYNEDVTGEKLISARKPDLSIFSEEELMTLASVKKDFKGWTAKRITDFSHDEKGYIETLNNKPISYDYAEGLKI